jgi:ribosomal protein S18 acetylase RimI-like enzyme
VTIREATEADIPAMEELVAAYQDELWAAPFPPPPLPDSYLREGRILVAELDGEVVGMAKGELQRGLGHVTFVYLQPQARGQGTSKALLRELVSFFGAGGARHVTLSVDLPNDQALAVWRRLGFADYRRSLLADLDALEQRLADGGAGSIGAVHVQTDDQAAIEKAVARFGPRIVRSHATVVSAPRNGWIGVYDDVASHEPDRLRKLASEVSNITGGVVIALTVEDAAVVRLVAFDRGKMMDEYLSVPEYYGALPPGDAVALRVNPTLLGRLTGAEPAAIRAIARVADSPAELPPANELLAGLADALGIEGAALGFDEAANLEGAVTVRHDG